MRDYALTEFKDANNTILLDLRKTDWIRATEKSAGWWSVELANDLHFEALTTENKDVLMQGWRDAHSG